jgi:hypothetical protein
MAHARAWITGARRPAPSIAERDVPRLEIADAPLPPIERRDTSERAVGDWNTTASPRRVQRREKHHAPPSTAEISPPRNVVARSWELASAAMREGDYRRAERAFDDLALSSDATTRDAARLARAQIWLAEGRFAEAHPELDLLSTSGSTPYIRQRASEARKAIP